MKEIWAMRSHCFWHNSKICSFLFATYFCDEICQRKILCGNYCWATSPSLSIKNSIFRPFFALFQSSLLHFCKLALQKKECMAQPLPSRCRVHVCLRVCVVVRQFQFRAGSSCTLKNLVHMTRDLYGIFHSGPAALKELYAIDGGKNLHTFYTRRFVIYTDQVATRASHLQKLPIDNSQTALCSLFSICFTLLGVKFLFCL